MGANPMTDAVPSPAGTPPISSSSTAGFTPPATPAAVMANKCSATRVVEFDGCTAISGQVDLHSLPIRGVV